MMVLLLSLLWLLLLSSLKWLTLLLSILLLLGRGITSHVDAAVTATTSSSNKEWQHNNFLPPISLDSYHRLHQLVRRLQTPRTKSFIKWKRKWPERHTTIPLNYGGKHPFELQDLEGRRLRLRRDKKQLRRTQKTSSSNSTTITTTSSAAAFQPIRIAYITDPLKQSLGGNALTDARINYILSTVLPQVQTTWSSHLQVVPTTGPIPINNEVCFGMFQDNNIPSDILFNGVDNADLVVIVTSSEVLTTSDGTSIDFCGTGTLAVSVLCAQDQFDRPIIGLMNFCPTNSTSSSSHRGGRRRNLKRQTRSNAAAGGGGAASSSSSSSSSSSRSVSAPRQMSLLSRKDEALVATHELAHTLGMSSELFPYFRNPKTGKPLTPRPIAFQQVACTGSGGRKVQYIPFAANNTLQVGISAIGGFIYYDVVTPRVRAVARNQFNCPRLRGARLESQDTSNSCVGSHWDQRLFFNELMGAVFWGTVDVLSPLTLALMEDTGWYRVVNYGQAHLSPFGQGAGCEFVEGSCIVNDQVPDYGKGYFCSKPTNVQPSGTISVANGTNLFCDPSHSQWAVCDLFDLQQIPLHMKDQLSDVPIRYFSNQNYVGIVPQSDYCPMPIIPARVACNDIYSRKIITYQGESYGSSSRCINAYSTMSNGKQRHFPGCFDVVCDATAFQVVVNGIVCQYDFQEITIDTIFSRQATMICPRLSAVCPDLFCPGDCSGRGVCNYSQRPPVCECFDSTDTSSDCSDGRRDASDVVMQSIVPPSPPPRPLPAPPIAITISPTIRPSAAAAAVTPLPTRKETSRPTVFVPLTSSPTNAPPAVTNSQSIQATTPYPTNLSRSPSVQNAQETTTAPTITIFFSSFATPPNPPTTAPASSSTPGATHRKTLLSTSGQWTNTNLRNGPSSVSTSSSTVTNPVQSGPVISPSTTLLQP